MLLTRNSGRARGTSRRSTDARRARISAGRADNERSPPIGCDDAVGVDRPKRNVGHRQDRPAHVAVAGIADQTHDLEAKTLAFIRGSLERSSHGILAVEVLLRESFVDDGNTRDTCRPRGSPGRR